MKNICSIVLLLFLMVGCSDDRKMVNLALKDDEKVYLVPFMANKNIVENELSNNKTPAIYKSVQLIKDRGELFVEPKNLKRVLNLVSNNYLLFEKKGNFTDGYVGFKNANIYTYSLNNTNTDKIGEQIKRETIMIQNEAENKSLEIIWTKSPKLKAEKNCVIKRLWFVEHPYAGTSVGDYRNTVVVSLNDIVDFYDNGTSLEYNESEEILYVIK